MKIEVGKLAYIERNEISPYAAVYVVPQRIKKNNRNDLVVHFHGSTTIENTIAAQSISPEELYDRQIEELLERISTKIHQELETDFIHLYVLRPRDTVSASYPMNLRDAQAFTKETIVEKYFTEEHGIYNRPDAKIAKLIKKFIQVLVEDGYEINQKYNLIGGSAGGNAANRLSILCPENIKAVALINAGLFTFPEKEWQGIRLYYPIGTYDLDKDAIKTKKGLKEIKHRIYIGEKDKNDPLMYDLYNVNYSIERLKESIGETPLERARVYTQYLKENKISAELKTISEGEHLLDFEKIHKEIYGWFESLRRGKAKKRHRIAL